mgnify:CR=1 FL=1
MADDGFGQGMFRLFSKLKKMSGRQAGLSSAHVISVTVGCPSVTVPVLSNRMLSICRAASKLSASLMRMPCSAPLPMPTMMAVGVASPSAQGRR